ncbi:molybdenum cofactor guanylyltransferase [Conexibacter stalactiti]|uniref:Probable molybdenum cofactor guanylyltransferase n=1 Tax=Conexibacter stalactiti TaxID=1940611 RepID=A0ABU4HM23_9ACTN|nr:molybdenum cofactor guanylyltransferase [Conexibacter stalactiti]MDW5594324.1 molybdenum cofactor guanylyltransferase [Conexibacter stalactiti]MEC5034966.1 molybdenum cofactor guanylyltransferase [Conexibacter stalactiti]
MGDRKGPIGVVLAGGSGRRIGGGKAVVELHGRPLVSYPVGVLQAALGRVAVVAKADTELPPLPGVEIWTEPEEPRHPLAGIVHALDGAQGRAVVVAAGDMPFLTEQLVRHVATAEAGGRPAVVPRAGGRMQPLLARYEPPALPLLLSALSGPPRPLTEVVERLEPRLLEADGDAEAFFNVNLPEDLLTATAMMDRTDPASR